MCAQVFLSTCLFLCASVLPTIPKSTPPTKLAKSLERRACSSVVVVVRDVLKLKAELIVGDSNWKMPGSREENEEER